MTEFIELFKAFKDVGGVGVALWIVTIVVIARWLVPRLEKWFDKHFSLVDTLQAKISGEDKLHESNADGHAATHKGLVHLANGLHAASPEDKKQIVLPHVEAVKQAVRIRPSHE